jgi:hypothetical protein
MKKIVAIAFLSVALFTLYGAPLEAGQQVVRPRQALRRSVAENAIYAFYVKQFQQEGEVTPEVFSKILPFIEQFIHERFEISNRRTAALGQLRQAVNSNGSEEDMKRLVRDIDMADAEFQANQARFFKNVDPLLNARQQARLRLLQITADNRLRQVLTALQNPAQQQNPAPVTVP